MGLGRKRKGQNRKYSDKKAKGNCEKMVFILIAMLINSPLFSLEEIHLIRLT